MGVLTTNVVLSDMRLDQQVVMAQHVAHSFLLLFIQQQYLILLSVLQAA